MAIEMTIEEKNTIKSYQNNYQDIIKNTKITNRKEKLDSEEKSWNDWYRKTYGYNPTTSGKNDGLCACRKHITPSYAEAMNVSLF